MQVAPRALRLGAASAWRPPILSESDRCRWRGPSLAG